mmetsp:Transcript_10831/g.31300  ORF Transcript_10831/g.31300 Transcript_10831/m.31300 type:complete len:210 (-) Transcript_10831:2566-3195(-)
MPPSHSRRARSKGRYRGWRLLRNACANTLPASSRKNATVGNSSLQVGESELPDAMPVLRRLVLAGLRRPAMVGIHVTQQRQARAIDDAEHGAGARQEALRDLPLALGVVLVPHVEHMEELDGVPESHARDLRIVIKGVHHFCRPFAGLLRFEELSHAETLARSPIDLHGGQRLDGEAHVVQVDCVQLHGSDTAGDLHPVDQAALRRHGL